jgi:hypothetical protein
MLIDAQAVESSIILNIMSAENAAPENLKKLSLAAK